MRYALAVLTHDDGSEGETIKRTIRSFDSHVGTPPVARFLYQDGPAPLPPFAPYPWTVLTGDRSRGFCRATAALWEMAARGDGNYDYVFWLEHDFEFRRNVSVPAMARILDDADGELAQVALMRGPVNDDEKRAGGLYEQMLERGHHLEQHDDHFVHQAFFTTNPMLMTKAFMQWRPWPNYPSSCEGRFGIDLRDDRYRFAFMGEGEPWVEHIGVRTGKGY